MRLCSLLGPIALLATALAANASLIGDSVHVSYLFPDTSTPLVDFGIQTVVNGLRDTNPGVSLTFSGNQIIVTNDSGLENVHSSFNGFDVALLAGSPFSNVSIDPSSSSVFLAGAILTSSANDIRLNIAGTCRCAPGSAIILNVTSDPIAVTPEPSSLALFGTGLLVVVSVFRKRATGAL